MKMTLNEALELAATGDWDAAWEVARQDEGLPAETTFADWKEFALRALSRRAEEARINEYSNQDIDREQSRLLAETRIAKGWDR